jgi:hypothetical protein
VQRGILNLNLDIGFFKLPTCVFSCSNLTVLKLMSLTIHHLSDVNFPLLKTLHLDSIDFLGVTDGFLILRIFNGCPILEDLKTKNLFVRASVMRTVKAGEFNGLLKLVRVNIINLNLNIPFHWVRNAKFLRAKLV